MADSSSYEYDVFISYSHKDEGWATGLATRLEQEVWQDRKLKVFFAPWDIKPGESIPERLEYALPRSRKVCLIMSPESAASEWVKLERFITTYIDTSERQTRLIPLLLRDCEIPPFLKPIRRVDFRDDDEFEEEYSILLATIKDEPLPRGRAVASRVSIPTLIPRPPLVGFVARRDSTGRDIVERLKEELRPEKNQVIVLSGSGGVGKTTLAAELARDLASLFLQRLVWISALGRDDFSLSTLLDEIATQLGHPELRQLAPEPKAEQVQVLIASPATLIVLDNFETVKPDEQNRCVNFLFNRASCPVLITTRQKTSSALNVVIDAMAQDEAEEFVGRLIKAATDSAAFEGIDRVRIINAAERNPLVMQWVVAQIDLAQDAESVLADLASGVGDAAQRVFDRSFGLMQLTDDGRRVLLALSLFAPDASRPLLAQVAGFDDDSKRLNHAVKQLSSLHLVKTAANGQRLTMDGLTRQLTSARLSRDNADEYRRRFVEVFVAYADNHKQAKAEDYDALEAEKDNLLNAMDVAFSLNESEQLRRLAYFTALPYNGMLSVHGYWDEALKRNLQALDASRRSRSDWDIAAFAHNAAGMFQQRGERHEARRLYEESLEIKRKLSNQSGIANTLHQLAMLAQDVGDLPEARRLYDECLEIKRKLGDQSGIAITLHQLAGLAEDAGDLPEARRLYDESLEIKRKLGNQSGIASTLHNLAVLAQAAGDLPAARRLYDESLEISRKLGNQSSIAGTLHQLARLAQAAGDLPEARRLYDESLEIKKKLGDQRGIAITLHQLGRLAHDAGDLIEARRLFDRSLDIKRKLGNQAGIAITLWALGLLAITEANPTDAKRLFREALVIFEKLNSPKASAVRKVLEILQVSSD